MISVMVVEDEMLMRTWLQDEISVIAPEFEVTATAANGRTALELMEKMPIDVLITDIKMPVMDGLTLCEIVNDRYPNVQKVILSGYDDFAYAQRSIETNIRGYLLKPVDTKKLKELLERIRKCTELIKMQNQTSSWHVESISWLCAQYYQAVMLGLGIQMDACTRLIGKTPYLNRYLLLLFAEQTYIDGAVDRDGEVLSYCQRNNITIQTWSPFQYGTFAGTFLGNSDFPELNRELTAIAEKYDTTNTAIAAAWILRHPAKMQLIAGSMKTSRLEEICKATQIELTKEEWYRLYLAAGHQLP